MTAKKSDKCREADILSLSLARVTKQLWETKLAKSSLRVSRKIVQLIESAVKDGGDIDLLLNLEKTFQQIDSREARTKNEKGSAKKSIDDYEQIDAVVAQMRTDPEAYVLANRSLQKDGLKLPPSRGTNQIRANVARLNNRNSFPSPEYKAIWEARIKLAKATQRKLAELHAKTIERYNRIVEAEDKA